MSSTTATKTILPPHLFRKLQSAPASPASSVASLSDRMGQVLGDQPGVVSVEEEDENQPMEEEAKERESKEHEEDREEQDLLDFQPAPALHDQRPPPPHLDLLPVSHTLHFPLEVQRHLVPYAPANPSTHPPTPPALFTGVPAPNTGIPVNPVGSNEAPSHSGGMRRKREENNQQIVVHHHLQAVQKARGELDQLMDHLEEFLAMFVGHHLDDASIGVGCPSSTYRQQDSAKETGVIQKSKTKQAQIDSYNQSVQALRDALGLMMKRLPVAYNSAYVLNRAENALTSTLTLAEVKAEEDRAKRQRKAEDAIHLLQSQQMLAQQLAPYSARQRK